MWEKLCLLCRRAKWCMAYRARCWWKKRDRNGRMNEECTGTEGDGWNGVLEEGQEKQRVHAGAPCWVARRWWARGATCAQRTMTGSRGLGRAPGTGSGYEPVGWRHAGAGAVAAKWRCHDRAAAAAGSGTSRSGPETRTAGGERTQAPRSVWVSGSQTLKRTRHWCSMRRTRPYWTRSRPG